MFTMRDAILAALCNGVLYVVLNGAGLKEVREVGGFCVLRNELVGTERNC